MFSLYDLYLLILIVLEIKPDKFKKYLLIHLKAMIVYLLYITIKIFFSFFFLFY